MRLVMNVLLAGVIALTLTSVDADARKRKRKHVKHYHRVYVMKRVKKPKVIPVAPAPPAPVVYNQRPIIVAVVGPFGALPDRSVFRELR